MTAVCWVGSKSLSHVLACIDRTKGRLLDMGSASEVARAQIISAVMSYWHAHPGIALSIVEKLLNYSILTPISVVDWALAGTSSTGGTQGGDSLGQSHVFELISNTTAKVTGRVRQLLTAPDADAETRDKEVKAMRELFSAINDALASWAGGSKDELMETGDGSSDREALVRRWGQRWHRVFSRMSAIEEAFVLEATKDKMVTDSVA
jgi:nuclear cap-binding protein subunit 1